MKTNDHLDFRGNRSVQCVSSSPGTLNDRDPTMVATAHTQKHRWCWLSLASLRMVNDGDDDDDDHKHLSHTSGGGDWLLLLLFLLNGGSALPPFSSLICLVSLMELLHDFDAESVSSV